MLLDHMLFLLQPASVTRIHVLVRYGLGCNKKTKRDRERMRVLEIKGSATLPAAYIAGVIINGGCCTLCSAVAHASLPHTIHDEANISAKISHGRLIHRNPKSIIHENQ
ncbi:hypothetical protein HanPI659440_Chr13g0497761 [Helianthus annuus]|nr:hypothetical protein HanPI659440_Chr13g0497761 [Helianthus annuus]